MEDLTGRQFGPYRIVEALATGGMAAVYKAFQPAVGRHVALKIHAGPLPGDREFADRFGQEARILARLQHPHILQIFDFGQTDGYAYLAMPLVDTGTLAARLSGRPLPLAMTERVIRQLADALDYAHSKGVIHRDIKPSNVLLDERDNCLLADFGIARLTEQANPMTVTGSVIGTPEYMSPEQVSGRPVGPASDIYSLGILLYELLTGRVPFKADTPIAVGVKVLTEIMPMPREFAPSLTPAVQAVVLKAVAREPGDRYPSATLLAADLSETIRDVREVRARPTFVQPRVESAAARPPSVVLAPEPAPGVAAESRTDFNEATDPAHRPTVGLREVPGDVSAPRRWVVPAGVLAVVLAVVALGYFGWPGAGPPTPAENRLSTPEYKTAPPPAPAPASSSGKESSPVDPWARATASGRAEDYEAYLAALLRSGEAGEHRAAAQTALAALWAPTPAAAPAILTVPELPWLRGHRGEGCAEPSAGGQSVSEDRTVVVYIAATKCGAADGAPALFLERASGEPRRLRSPFLGQFRLTGDGTRVLIRDRNTLDVVSARDGSSDPRVAALPPWARADSSDAVLGTNGFSRDGRVIAVRRDNAVSVFDLTTGVEDRLPATTDGRRPDKPVSIGAVSDTGRFLTLYTGATNLVSGVNAANTVLYLYDRQTKQLAPINRDAVGRVPEAPCWKWFDDLSAVGDDGQWVVFTCNVGTLSLLGSPPQSRANLYARHVPSGRTWLVDHSVLSAYDGNPTFTGIHLLRSDLLIVERYSGADAKPDRVVYWMTLPTGARAQRVLQNGQWSAAGSSWSDRRTTVTDAGCFNLRDTSQWCVKR